MSDGDLAEGATNRATQEAEGCENADGDDRQNDRVLSHRLAVFLCEPRLELGVQIEHSSSPCLLVDPDHSHKRLKPLISQSPF